MANFQFSREIQATFVKFFISAVPRRLAGGREPDPEPGHREGDPVAAGDGGFTHIWPRMCICMRINITLSGSCLRDLSLDLSHL